MLRPTSNVGKAARKASHAIIAGTGIVTGYNAAMGNEYASILYLGVGALVGIATVIAYYKPTK